MVSPKDIGSTVRFTKKACEDSEVVAWCDERGAEAFRGELIDVRRGIAHVLNEGGVPGASQHLPSDLEAIETVEGTYRQSLR